MACFIVPAAEAVITTIAEHAVKNKELKAQNGASHEKAVSKIPFSRKLGWLSKMLWGGSALLAFEHIWHGEVTAWFPFLTAASDPQSAMEMFKEMATAGVLMAAFVTAAWLCMVAISSAIEKRAAADDTAKG